MWWHSFIADGQSRSFRLSTLVQLHSAKFSRCPTSQTSKVNIYLVPALWLYWQFPRWARVSHFPIGLIYPLVRLKKPLSLSGTDFAQAASYLLSQSTALDRTSSTSHNQGNSWLHLFLLYSRTCERRGIAGLPIPYPLKSTILLISCWIIFH